MADGTDGLLARLSWAIPCVGLAILGLLVYSEAMRPPPEVQLAVVVFSAVIGLFAAIAALLVSRRRQTSDTNAQQGRRTGEALLGGACCAITLALLGTGVLAGSAEKSRKDQTVANAAGFGQEVLASAGWYGAVEIAPNTRVFAREVPNTTYMGVAFASNFVTPFGLMIVGASNGGKAPIEIDLATVEIESQGGKRFSPLERGKILSEARQGRAELQQAHGGPYQVLPGRSLGNGWLFLPPDMNLAQIDALVLRVNGEPIRVEGRIVKPN